jgi:hypothetical protein
VYGGFSKSEQAEYDSRAERIHELDAQLQTPASADKAAAEQRGEDRTKKKPNPEGNHLGRAVRESVFDSKSQGRFLF